jgi:hypothetical protein
MMLITVLIDGDTTLFSGLKHGVVIAVGKIREKYRFIEAGQKSRGYFGRKGRSELRPASHSPG